uniref:Uncharacterized protein n=1 Tax=Anguilla anguilla TaxID=7936 RepID=A0A0E9VGG7_ANGAN
MNELLCLGSIVLSGMTNQTVAHESCTPAGVDLLPGLT